MNDAALLSAIAAIVAAVGGIIGAAITAWVQERRESGKVETADAQVIFSSANQLIQLLLQAMREMTRDLRELTDKIDLLVRKQEEIIKMQDAATCRFKGHGEADTANGHSSGGSQRPDRTA